MKSFKTHLQEAFKTQVDSEATICDLLKLDAMTFISLVVAHRDGKTSLVGSAFELEKKLNDKAVKHLRAVSSWFDLGDEGSSKAAYMKYIQTMAACPNKASWATWQGTGYRGVVKSKEWAKTNLKFTGETLTKSSTLYAVAEAVYQSKFAAQSWTDNWHVASTFANNYRAWGPDTTGIPLIFETQLNRNNTFLSPKFSDLYGYEERETIRVENNPTKMKVYVEIGLIIAEEYTAVMPISKPGQGARIGSLMRGTPAAKIKPDEWWRNHYMKVFTKAFGEASAKKLMGMPKVLAKIKSETGVAV